MMTRYESQLRDIDIDLILDKYDDDGDEKEEKKQDFAKLSQNKNKNAKPRVSTEKELAQDQISRMYDMYWTGVSSLFNSDIIMKLFWSMFDDCSIVSEDGDIINSSEIIDSKFKRTYSFDVSKELKSELKEIISTVAENDRTQFAFQLIHHLIINLGNSIKDAR